MGTIVAGPTWGEPEAGGSTRKITAGGNNWQLLRIHTLVICSVVSIVEILGEMARCG